MNRRIAAEYDMTSESDSTDATPDRVSRRWLILPETRAQRIRLLCVSTVLPALCVITSHEAFRFVEFKRSFASIVILFALLAGQIAILGCAAGRFVTHLVWRWLVFVWGVVLVDLLVYASPSTASYGWNAPELANAMLSGQIGLFIVWGILGRVGWAWRLPAVAVAIVSTFLVSTATSRDSWIWSVGGPALVWCHGIGMTIVAVGLRWLRFGLERTNELAGVTELPRETVNEPIESRRIVAGNAPVSDAGKPIQFSIMNLLVWMTATGAVLTSLRLIDWAIFHDSGSNQNSWQREITLGAIMAMLSIMAMWAALGNGAWWWRLIFVLTMIPSTGIAASLISVSMDPWYQSRGSAGQSLGSLLQMADTRGWIAWVCLSAYFLAASLLIFRASGYRLQRRPR